MLVKITFSLNDWPSFDKSLSINQRSFSDDRPNNVSQVFFTSLVDWEHRHITEPMMFILDHYTCYFCLSVSLTHIHTQTHVLILIVGNYGSGLIVSSIFSTFIGSYSILQPWLSFHDRISLFDSILFTFQMFLKINFTDPPFYFEENLFCHSKEEARSKEEDDED